MEAILIITSALLVAGLFVGIHELQKKQIRDHFRQTGIAVVSLKYRDSDRRPFSSDPWERMNSFWAELRDTNGKQRFAWIRVKVPFTWNDGLSVAVSYIPESVAEEEEK